MDCRTQPTNRSEEGGLGVAAGGWRSPDPWGQSQQCPGEAIQRKLKCNLPLQSCHQKAQSNVLNIQLCGTGLYKHCKIPRENCFANLE